MLFQKKVIPQITPVSPCLYRAVSRKKGTRSWFTLPTPAVFDFRMAIVDIKHARKDTTEDRDYGITHEGKLIACYLPQ